MHDTVLLSGVNETSCCSTMLQQKSRVQYHIASLTLMLQLGGILPPRRTFYPVALKPLRIVTKPFATFPEYMWAKKC